MKEMDLNGLLLVNGGGWMDVASGVLCGYGLATIATVVGGIVAIAGCSLAFYQAVIAG